MSYFWGIFGENMVWRLGKFIYYFEYCSDIGVWGYGKTILRQTRDSVRLIAVKVCQLLTFTVGGACCITQGCSLLSSTLGSSGASICLDKLGYMRWFHVRTILRFPCQGNGLMKDVICRNQYQLCILARSVHLGPSFTLQKSRDAWKTGSCPGNNRFAVLWYLSLMYPSFTHTIRPHNDSPLSGYVRSPFSL